MPPRDFDYSPYFSIIKYPFLGMNDIGLYRRLPWDKEGDPLNEQPPSQQVSKNKTEPKVPAAAVDNAVARSKRRINFAGLHRKEV